MAGVASDTDLQKATQIIRRQDGFDFEDNRDYLMTTRCCVFTTSRQQSTCTLGQWVQHSLPVPELLTMASCRKDWKRISSESFIMSPR